MDITMVVLKYQNKNRMRYQVCAEYLRFLGIFVWEKNDMFKESDTLGDKEADKDVFAYTIPDEKEEQHLGNIDISGVIDDLLQKLELAGIAVRENGFSYLKDVFENNNLFSAAVTIQYDRLVHVPIDKIPKKNNDDGTTNVKWEVRERACKLLRNSSNRFEHAADEIESKLKKLEGSKRHLWYAKLYCQQRANFARYSMTQPLLKPTNWLADECQELLTEYPNFINARVLQGKVYEFTKSRLAESLASYDLALKKIGAYPFAASIYYWKGKQCEEINGMETISEAAYEKANRADSNKYRVIYKIAKIQKKNHMPANTLKYFEKCIRILESKDGYLDPLEQEYYFKVCAQMAYLYINEYDSPDRCLEMTKKALQFRKKLEICSENDKMAKVYVNVYGKNEWKECRKIILDRMNPKQIKEYAEFANKMVR